MQGPYPATHLSQKPKAKSHTPHATMSDAPFARPTSRPADAIRSFPCRRCGAALAWSPGQAVLECAHCGHREAIPTTPEAIQEYDLETALLRLPRTEGWGTERRALCCGSCGAVTTFEPGQIAGQCAFCASHLVTEQASSANLIRPESLVPFKVDRAKALALFRAWIGGLWLRPSNLKQASQIAAMTGAYIPFWTFDALTSSHWTAEAGHYYYVTETYQDRDEKGHVVTRTRQVRHTRWEPASGSRRDAFDDELVCASRGLQPDMVRAICPYDLATLMPYEPGYLAGFVGEEYQVDLAAGWEAARARIQQKVDVACAGDVPGDTHRSLVVHTAFSGLTYKHILLPVWVSAYLYRSKTYRFLVNGDTGETSGEAPYSAWKIFFLVLAITIVGVVIAVVGEGR